MKILITYGGTTVPIDDVRHIGNMSSGRFGCDLARRLLMRGNGVHVLRHKQAPSPLEVTLNLASNFKNILERLIAADDDLGGLSARMNVFETPFNSFDEYASSLEELVTGLKPDIVILAAAVSDYSMAPTKGKISSHFGDMILRLEPTPKLLPEIKRWSPNSRLVGFKLLADREEGDGNLKHAALKTLVAGPCEMVAGNFLSDIRAGKRSYTLFYADGGILEVPYSKDLAGEMASQISKLMEMPFVTKKN